MQVGKVFIGEKQPLGEEAEQHPTHAALNGSSKNLDLPLYVTCSQKYFLFPGLHIILHPLPACCQHRVLGGVGCRDVQGEGDTLPHSQAAQRLRPAASQSPHLQESFPEWMALRHAMLDMKKKGKKICWKKPDRSGTCWSLERRGAL